MGFLHDKKILITGMISHRSIAYGIASACYEQGAKLAFTYVNDRFKNRVITLAKNFASSIILPCDVTNDFNMENAFSELNKYWNNLDGLVHSIGFAPKEAISGGFFDGLTRENFRIAHEISTYSFPAIAKLALPLMKNCNGSMITISYLGAERAVPNYNVMGMAKASLEAGVRYLANELGSLGIRVNAISSGPIKTLAASGIKNFSKILKFSEKNSPLKRNVSIQDIGNVAAFLLSDLSSGITGEITHVDGGLSISLGEI
ncbi:MAG: SDR family oxidoreductase [Bordetella sp.]|nr:MAG: SDR family oxidoreductase [Bordetella sp.]